MINILDGTQYALKRKVFENGLNKYTQSNCQITLTDSGYRIYRPANLTVANNGNTMWGGLIINPFSYDSNALIQGRSYCLMFDVNGVSTNNNERYWSNQAGWSGGGYGLGTSPTVLAENMVLGADFSGSKKLYYAFTVSDSVYKTCTTSYSSFVAGTSYNTYRDFKWGYNYTSTGAKGTDIYINNIRMFDITNVPITKTLSNGVLDVGAIIEYGDSLFSEHKYGEVWANSIVED